jgi:glycosyltransferase involved in cell wall biosynthesis
VRIGVDAGRIAHGPGGVASYTRELIRALAAPGVEHEIVLFDLDGGSAFSTAVEETYGRLPQRVRIAANTREELQDLDVFHAPGFAIPAAGGPSVVFTVHDLTVLSHPECHTLANRVRTLASVADALASGATILAVSEATRREALRLLALPVEKVEVLPPILNPCFCARGDVRADEATAQRLGINDLFVLAVGSLEPRKNLERLLDAWMALPGRLRRTPQLVVVGEEGWRQRGILRRLRDLTQSESVVRAERLRDRELAALYRRARALVFPSLAEGFGLPVAEAMACGAPVVTSNSSSLPEVAGDAAILVDPEDVDAIAAAVAGVLEDEGLRRDLRECGYERSRSFTRDALLPRLLEIYWRAAQRSNIER